jgi:hypothetical protein
MYFLPNYRVYVLVKLGGLINMYAFEAFCRGSLRAMLKLSPLLAFY